VWHGRVPHLRAAYLPNRQIAARASVFAKQIARPHISRGKQSYMQYFIRIAVVMLIFSVRRRSIAVGLECVMKEKGVQEDVQISKQQPAEKHARAKKGVAKTQEGPQVAERGAEAQKREAVGGKAQKNAVARDKSAVEGKAPEAKAEAASHEAGAPATEHADAQATDESLSKDSQAAPSSPDVGQAAPKDIEGAAQAVQQLAASPGKQAADAIEAVSEAIGRSHIDEEEVSVGAAIGRPSHDANDVAAKDADAVIGHSSHDAKDVAAKDTNVGATTGSPSSGGEVETASPQKQSAGGGGDAGGGGVGVPSIGGAVAIPKPKAPNLGDGAVGRWAAPGMAGRLKEFSKLGDGLGTDAGQAFDNSDAKLPDEGKAEKKVADTAAKKAKAGEGAAKTKIAAQNRKSPELKVPSQTATKMLGSDDALGAKPPVEADLSTIETAAHAAHTEKSAAQTDGATAHTGVDRTLDKRGFEDVRVEKPVIEKPQYKASGELGAEDLDLVEGEAAEILDASEFAEQNVDNLKAAQESEKQAYEAHENSVDDSVKQYDTDASAAREKAHADEESEVVKQGQELNSQLDSEKAGFDSEIEGKAAEAKADTDAARDEIDAEKAQTQSKVDSEYDAAKQEESAASKESENKKKSWWDKVVDAAKQALDWLKSKVKAIFDKARQLINKLVEGFINFVAKISKGLADKLRALYEALKNLVSKLIEALKKIVDAIIEAIKAALEAIAQWLIEAIQALIEGLKAALKAIQAALLAALDALEAIAKAIMESAVGGVLKKIFEAACKLVGVDPSIFATAFGALRDIISNPGRFFKALGHGFVDGFRNFGKNIGENIKIMITNLLNIWLSPVGVKVPSNIPSLTGFIELGFSLVGIDISKITGILAQLMATEVEESGEEGEADDADGGVVEAAKPKKVKSEDPISEMFAEIQAGGLAALAQRVLPNLMDVAKAVLPDIILEVGVSLVKKGVAKLALMANPVGGIAAALKAVWDLIDFVRSNMSQIMALVTAVTNTLAAAAKGDSSAVANGVEAALCQGIPLAIELIARLLGLNVGGLVKKVFDKISGAIKGAVDKVLLSLRKSTGGAVNIKTSKERKAESDKKEAERKAEAEALHKKRLDDDADATGFRQKAASAGLAGERLSQNVAGMKKAQKESVVSLKGVTKVIEGKKEGSFLDLNNSKTVQAADAHYEQKRKDEQIRKQYEERQKRIANGTATKADQKAMRKEMAHAEQARRDGKGFIDQMPKHEAQRYLAEMHRIADAEGWSAEERKQLAELDKKYNPTVWDSIGADRTRRNEAAAADRAKTQAQAESDRAYLAAGHSRRDLETRNRVMSTISAETIQKHEAAKAEQARLDAWFQSKEGPDGDLPPGMTREEFNKWQLGSDKLNEQRVLDQVDGNALLALRVVDSSEASGKEDSANYLIPGLGRSLGAAARINITSAIGNSSYAIKQAEGLSEQAQNDVDMLIAKLRDGNHSPGIGTRFISGGYHELRGANAGRVIIKHEGSGEIVIVGKFQGHKRGDSENSRVIQTLIREYESGRK